MKFKQIFCCHIYKVISEEYLGQECDDIDPTMGGGQIYHKFVQKIGCVKCGKIDHKVRFSLKF